MIDVKIKSQCCGCTACKEICPVNCITMVPDNEGFLYPQADADRCINCGKCDKVCPCNNADESNSICKVYGAKNYNETVRAESSSGGTFTLLAENIIKSGGIVYGCAMTDDCTACHIRVDNIKDLKKLRSSKYVQSRLGDIFRTVKEDLDSGKEVLFSGTPCQAAGLKNYLKKPYENLLTIDVLCHGVPSPKLLKDYREILNSKYESEMDYINFRNKEKSWKRLFIDARFKNGKRHFIFSGYDAYLSAFLNNISQRPSCFECRFASQSRQGDITLGDFWGIGRKYPKFDDDKGISLIITNNGKGEKYLKAVKQSLNIFESDIDTAIAGNKVLCQPPKMNPNRNDFYKAYETYGLQKAIDKYVDIPSKPKQIYYNLMRRGLDIYRKIFNKGY